MYQNLRDLLEHAVQTNGNGIFVKSKKNGEIIDYTYSRFYSDVRNTANAILCLDDIRVGLISENCYEWLVAYLSVVNSGLTLVPIDVNISEKSLRNVINMSDINTLIISEKCYLRLKSEGYSFDELKNVYLINVIEDVDHLRLEDLTEQGRKEENLYENIVLDEDATAVIIFTSGTTSDPKGVMISHRNLATNCEGTADGIKLEKNTKAFTILPLFHSYACMTDFLYTIYRCSTMCICSDLRYVYEELKEYEPDYIFMVPLFLNQFLPKIHASIVKCNNNISEGVYSVFGKNIKSLFCGGAPLNAEIVKKYSEYGITVVGGYGTTECSPLIAVHISGEENDISSVGKSIICNDVRIVNGEIQVKGTNVTKGYYKRDDLTREAFDGEWFKTGDAGYIDEKGQIFITGRLKNVIILDNGKNIYPEEIEEILQTYEEVEECIVFQDVNKKKQSVVAVVFYFGDLDQNNELAEFIINDINMRLPSYMAITNYYLSSTPLVKTSSNKINRNMVIKNIHSIR
jgi:long-chain acyl-CoA synthetase